MIRALMVGCLALGLAGTPVLAKDSKKENCEKQADILDLLVAMRLDGVSEDKAIASLIEGEQAVEPDYHFAVKQYGGWIYSQRRQDANKHQRGPFIQACLSH